MHTTMLGNIGPPYAIMPSYITAFQSSPVRIYNKSPSEMNKKEFNRQREGDLINTINRNAKQ